MHGFAKDNIPPYGEDVERMSETVERVAQAVWSGSFRIFGCTVLCHTLDDGRRIVDAESMNALLECLTQGVATMDPGDGQLAAFTRWQRGA